MEVVKDAPPEVKQKALDAIRNSPRYLAVPVGVGVGGSLLDRASPTEVYLTPDGLPR